MASVNRLWLTYCRPPCNGHLHPPCKVQYLCLEFVKFVNGVRPSNKWPVRQQVYFSYCINCHDCALLVNGHRLATNGDVPEWGRHSTMLSSPKGTGKSRYCTYTSINYRLIVHQHYSHLWAKHLEVAALRECNGDIEQKYNWGHGKISGHKV